MIGGVLGGIGLLALLTGCAFTTDHIVITYTPDQNVAKIQGAEAVNLKIEFIDARTTKNQVGSKKNGYGMETAPIVATNDMAILFSDVIQTELKSRGFIIGNGPVQVIIELTKFYCDFKVGMWSGSAVAEVSMSVQVKKPDGNIGFVKTITGNGMRKGCQLASGKNAKAALDQAMKDAVLKLVNDKDFLAALFLAAKK